MKYRYFIVFLLALFCVIPGCFEFLGLPISGREFSPDSFTERSFTYWRSPFSGTIRGKRILKTLESECESLVTLKLIPPAGTSKRRWDLTSESLQTTDILSADFDARFLTEYLNYTTDNWNRNNVEKAELLWPEIALLVRERLYLQLPPLFVFAINSPEAFSNEEFEEQLNIKLGEAWFQAATVTAARAESNADPDAPPAPEPATVEDAKRFLDKAIEFDPKYEDALLLEMPLQESPSKK